MIKTVRKYTQEFKIEAVKLALRSPSISGTAGELGVPIPTLHTWINNLKGDSKPINLNAEDKPNMTALIEENRRLNKELAKVREEKDILKKAAAYFAQNQK
jgi:transposase